MSQRMLGKGLLFALVTTAACGLITQTVSSRELPDNFPEYFSKDPERPMRMLAQKSFDTSDGHSENPLPIAPRASQPFGAAGHLLSRVRFPQDVARPLTLRFDVVAGAVARQGENVRATELEMDIALACRSPREICANTSPLALEHVAIQLDPRVKLSLNPWSFDGSTYARAIVDGIERVLMKGQESRAVSVPPGRWTEADLIIAFPRKTASARDTRVIHLRASLLQGDFTETEPSLRARMRVWLRRQGIGAWTVVVAGFALVCMGAVAWRTALAGRNEDAPRTFGALVFLWGSLLAAAPITFYFLERDTQGTLYFTVTGLLFALSGVFAFFGRSAAKSWYLASYLLSLGWTFIEFDVFSSQTIVRLGLQTLIGVYLWHLARSGSLQATR